MLSKEEIEKAKERLVKQAVTSKVDYEDYPNCICMKKDLKTLLQYIDQLEQENKKQNEESYWKGYIQKQNEAVEICKICKYKKQYFEKKVGAKKMEENSEKFDLKSKLESMIKMSKEIIDEDKQNEYQGEPPIEICLAYDVYNYLPKLSEVYFEKKVDEEKC